MAWGVADGVVKYRCPQPGHEESGLEDTSLIAEGRKSTKRIFSRLYSSQRRGVVVKTVDRPVVGSTMTAAVNRNLAWAWRFSRGTDILASSIFNLMVWLDECEMVCGFGSKS